MEADDEQVRAAQKWGNSEFKLCFDVELGDLYGVAMVTQNSNFFEADDQGRLSEVVVYNTALLDGEFPLEAVAEVSCRLPRCYQEPYLYDRPWRKRSIGAGATDKSKAAQCTFRDTIMQVVLIV